MTRAEAVRIAESIIEHEFDWYAARKMTPIAALAYRDELADLIFRVANAPKRKVKR